MEPRRNRRRSPVTPPPEAAEGTGQVRFRYAILFPYDESQSYMPSRKKTGSRTRHGSRKLIVKVFEDPNTPRSLNTSEIFRRVQKAGGSDIPEYSIRSALRTLVRRKVLKETRKGREKMYTVLAGGAAPKAPEMPVSPALSAPVAEVVEVTEAVAAVPVATTPAGPHKLAVGEALILHVEDDHVESVTNVHGRLVVERHPRSKRSKD